jgi:type IV pilus assembly protein PilE
MTTHYRQSHIAGFTLVELMVTIVIATILLSIAIPAYTSQIRKSRRTEAKTTLLDLAGREERFFSTSNAYTNSAQSLGYGSSGTVSSMSVGSGYYTITVTAVAANPGTTPPTPPSFSVTATAAGSQQADTLCYTFTVDSTGKQSSTDSSLTTTTTQSCWN